MNPVTAPSRPRPRPTDAQSPFALEDLFFSTTDSKGYITYGNDIFVNVSRYPREALIGAPHRIIRHPDMPRIIFQLLWETIQAGKGIAAYVKNMAADGAYYWVLAVVTPVDNGYLSVRLKPTSDLFHRIPDFYATLHRVEAQCESDGGSKFQAIEASRALLGKTLSTLGFVDYDAFQHAALTGEVCARCATVKAKPSKAKGSAADACRALAGRVAELFGKLETLATLQRELTGNAESIRQLASVLQRLSLNAHIRAMHMNEAGSTLEVVADHMNRSARFLSERSSSLAAMMARTDQVLIAARSSIATGDVSVEMMNRFVDELDQSSSGSDASLRAHIARLAQVVASRLRDACDAAQNVSSHVAQLNVQLDDFRKQVRTLEILHITGKAEAIRASNGGHVSMIFEEVHATTCTARARLDGLIELIASAEFDPPDMKAFEAHLSRLREAA